MSVFKSKILIVDDNEPVLLLINKILKGPGRTIITVNSGKKALEIINKENDISLILMDIQMPGMDGFDTVKKIKENERLKDIPVIFITGFYKSEEYVNEGYEIGAYDYIQKPFEAQELKNKVNVFLTIHHQRTQLNMQAEQMRILLRSIVDGVIKVSKSGAVLFANKSAEDILDLGEVQIIGQPLGNVLQSFDANNNPIKINLMDWINVTNSPGKRQLTIQTNKGKRKIISIGVSEIKDSSGNADGSVIVFNDITETLRLQNQKALSQKMESVGQLASGIAHEINTPMQFVGDNTFFINDAFSSLLQYIKSIEDITKKATAENPDIIAEFNKLKNDYDIDFLMEEIPVAIDRTQNGIKRVSKIVLAMKNFAHPSAKQKALSNINQGVDVTVTISRNEWKYIAELETRLEPDLPLVQCTIDEINQVILNMIVNAAHAIEEAIGKDTGKQGKITIETKSDNEFVYIILHDTGKGIPQEIQSRIFDPFFTTKEVGKGTGQGLAIAHDIIVNKHKGEITVESEVGKGTTFTLKLPINSKQESAEGEK
ncbi:MAG: hypothetical protein A2X61_00255 [Ignavibacteria bacterium GWB2_35_12]|nr:MAG: hypothetical protein A2X63_02065 [Ignavibacteria bacterium GWA2_35_8]OGU41727.1 MAG: hypothetical protein A2X61_00255 [Ignavibacteria bacterium GWB2_35_12]OGU90589.1 MAG: hypothetical protein A2220_12960 [Ignavibacteria bacterium RIFOXYA2_FULL_35_10]OGV23344.1 MAG: hypothetical protein A2475_06790 [Ignavibacteria bacterium RIFOXYC2_FULL_35_21]